MLAKRGIVEDEDTNLFPVAHQTRRVENWFSSAENMIGRSRNWNRNSIKNSIRRRDSDEKPPKKDKRRKLEAKVDGAYAKFSEKVDEENRRFDEKRDKIVQKAARSNGKHSEEMKSWIPSFTRRYRFTWRQNEKEDVAPLGVVFGRINLGRMRNYSRHRGRSTGPRESVKKDCFGDGRGGLGSTIGLRQAISLL